MRKLTAIEIKKIRTELSLTQEEMAHKIGVAYSTIFRWEKGISKPSKLAIIRITELKSEAKDG